MNQFFKSNSTVLFQGDSITDCGRTKKKTEFGFGYPAKIISIYQALYPDSNVKFVNRAVSGDRVRDLLQRYKSDFLEIHPDFISILIGVNDTWRRFDRDDPCPIDRFEKEYDELLTKITNDMPNTIIMLITPFLLDNDPNKKCYHPDLNEKIEKVKELANKYKCLLFDYDSILREKIESKEYTQESVSKDGVHPTDFGQSLLAIEYLKRLKIIE
ncbi:hypothetical protein M9Y10_038714 [Tritrichomonas musculus]|uniref:SGNH hydrolase-type esterase domain-containing protein n=1 Tax=Tritrichomonas musculus TaxID=1915356 RepID=A0ABR2KA71_9EUKA